MEARYPNAGNPSPGEIFSAYKDLPQVPGGMQVLQNTIQQNQTQGAPGAPPTPSTMRGFIAASVLNSANQANQAPPMPQGTVVDSVMAQAQPPMDPNMMGLAAPGLEQYAQQQSMADGGLVAFAQGGPIQGYSGTTGSEVKLHQYPWIPLGESVDPNYSEYAEIPTDVPDVTYADIPVPGHMGGSGKATPGYFDRPEGDTELSLTPTSRFWQRPGVDPSRAQISEIYNRIGKTSPVQRAESAMDFLGSRIQGAPQRWAERLSGLDESHAAHQQKVADARQHLFANLFGGGEGSGSESYAPEFVEAMNENPTLPSMPAVAGKGVPVSFGSGETSKGIPAAGGPTAEPTVVVDTGDRGIPAAAPAAEERTTGGTSSKVPKLSADQQVEELARRLDGDHSKAAELKGQLEKRLASKENKDLISDIAIGIGMALTGQGTKTQAVGSGLMALAAQHGRSGEAQEKQQATIDALTLQEEAQHNAALKAAMQTIYGTQAKTAAQEQAHKYKLEEIGAKGQWDEAAAAARATGEKGQITPALRSNLRKDARQIASQQPGYPAMSSDEQDRLVERYFQQMLKDQQYTTSTPGGTIPRVKYTPPAA